MLFLLFLVTCLPYVCEGMSPGMCCHGKEAAGSDAWKACGKAVGTARCVYGHIQEDGSLYTALHGGLRYNYAQTKWALGTFFYFQFFRGTWEVAEYVDDAVASTGGEYEDEAEYRAYVERNKDYLGRQLDISWENIKSFGAKTEGGFFYRTHADLFATYRQPPTLGVSPPFVGGWISLRDWDEEEAMSLFADSTGKVYLTVRGYFFLLERIDGGGSGGVPYLWEEWADKPQPWPVL